MSDEHGEAGCEGQLKWVADYIMFEVPGEPSRSEGAGDCAVRIMKDLRTALAAAAAREQALRQALEGHVLLVDTDGYCICHICHANASSCAAVKHHESCVLSATAPQPAAAATTTGATEGQGDTL